MVNEVRKSGIAVIGDVAWGTHFCQFYQTKQDLIDTLVPYFKTGLENNEFCMWVTADNLTTQEARKAMVKAMPGFSGYLKKGQIEILPYNKWYLKSGSFDSQRVLDGWVEKLNQAIAKGYDGLRLTGNTFWLEKEQWRSFADYEESVNNVIGKYKIIALCTYCLDKCNAAEIVDVIRNHEFALIKQAGKWEIFENSRYKTMKQDLAENEKRFRLALKNAPVTVAAQDKDLHFLWAYNQRTVNPADVLGKTDFDIFPEEVAERLTGLKRKVMKTGKALNEKMWVTSGDQKLYLDLFLEPTRNEAGKITGVEIATVDLTQQKLMERELEESEKKYRGLFENNSEGLALCEMVLDKNGKPVDYRFLSINPLFEKFIGLTSEQITGKTAYEVIPQVQPKAIETFARVVSSGKPVHFENYSRDLKKWFDVYAYRTRPGQFGYMVMDITARKQAEEALQESEERFRVLSESSPIIISVTRISDSTVLYVNQAYTLSLGYKYEELIGNKAVNVYLDPNDRKTMIEQLNKQGFLQNYEIRIKKADGTPFWASTSVHFINYSGEPAIMAATIDITARKQAEEASKESEARFKAIAANTPDHIIVQDRNLRYTFVVNPQLGLKGKDMVGKTDYDILNQEDADRLTKLKRQVIESGNPVQVETPLVNNKGETNYFSGSYVPKFNEQGNVDGLIGYFRNITERKQTELEVIRLNRELQAIRECDQIIVHSTDETSLLTEVCRILCKIAGYSLAWVGSVDHNQTKTISPLVWHGDGDYLTTANITWADTKRGRGPTGLTARTGKIHYFQDFATDQKAKPWREAALSRGYRSSIAIPLKGDDNSVFAVLSLYSPEPDSFTPVEIRLLKELASDISFGIMALREKAKRHQAEAEKAYLATFPELNPNPILELDINGQVKYLNPAAKAQLPELLTSGAQHPYLAGWENSVQQLKPSDENKLVTREIQVGELWYEQIFTYVESTNSYRLYGRNITERKTIEESLKTSERRNRLILETTLDGVWINDLSGRFLYVNDAYCNMIGYTRDELTTMSIQDIEAAEKPDQTNSHLEKIVRRGGDVFETRHKRKDGTVIDVEISAKYINIDAGQLIVFARDITARKAAENALKGSERRFNNAFHSSPVALSISRISDGTFIDVNQSFLHLFGYKREELIGHKALELNIYNNPGDRNEIVRQLQQNDKVVNYEVTAHTKTGNEIKALTSAEKIEFDGQMHIIWTTIDITEREQAEDLLRETSNYLNNLLDYANAPIIVWDTHFRISRFNPAFERLTGYKSQEVIGLGLDILFPENRKAQSLQQIRRTLSGERWDVVEIPILRVDGEIRTVLWNSANVYDTDGKTIIATIAQGQDITERKLAEEAMKTSEIKYRRLFEAAKDGILLLDADTGFILDVNPFLVDMLGLPKNEFIGKSLWELGYFRDIIASKANFLELQKNQYIRYEDLPLRTFDGREMKVEFVSNMYEVDHLKIIQCNVRDITKRKQAEAEVKNLNEILKHRAAELEVSNKELEAFAYSVSHDLRAPLRSMEGFSQALLEDCFDSLNDQCKDYLRRIQSSAELMAQLIDDLLRLSRITRAEMFLDNVNLSEMVNIITSELKQSQPERKAEFFVTPGLTAQGDDKLLRVVFNNLLENAWKFTGKTDTARIEFSAIEKDGQKAYFIRDNGAGFDMKYVDKLFSPFQRLHSSDEFPGTGIGLASVQRIIHRHGGLVWAEGKIGEGATFYFTLG